MRADQLLEQFDIQLKLTHFPLHPKTPDEGITLEQLFAGRNVDIQASQERLQNVMQREGLPYGERSMTYNSRLAQELGTWAEEIKPNSSIHQHLYQAYFVKGLNLADIEVLVAAAVQAGLAASEARDVLESRHCQANVDRDWQRCRELGVTSVPTYLVNDQRLVGAHSCDVLQQLVTAAGATPRETP